MRHDAGPDVVLRAPVLGRLARNRAEKALRCAARDAGPTSPRVTGALHEIAAPFVAAPPAGAGTTQPRW